MQNVSDLGDFSWEIVIRKLAEERLEKLNQELEGRVLERTAALEKKNEELERANKLFVGRELRMIELKNMIKELEGLNGQSQAAPSDNGERGAQDQSSLDDR